MANTAAKWPTTSPAEQARLGRASRQYAETHLSQEIILAQFFQELIELTQTRA